jgi:hypothetical protein
MENYQVLSQCLLPLRIFGLQFYSPDSVTPYGKIKKTPTHRELAQFILQFPFFAIACSYYYIRGFINLEDVATAHNFLQYSFKVITYLGRMLVIVIAIIESLLCTKSCKKILIYGWRVSETLYGEFNFHHLQYSKLKIVMKRRLVLTTIALTALEFLPLVNAHEWNVENVCMLLSKLLGAVIMSCAVIKFCFYVDFVNIHLNLLTIVIGNGFNLLNEKDKIRKLNILRRCYIEIIDMSRRANGAATFTLTLLFSIISMCLVRRAYRFYALFTGRLNGSAFVNTLLNNTSEEIAYICAICCCCNRTDIVVSIL